VLLLDPPSGGHLCRRDTFAACDTSGAAIAGRHRVHPGPDELAAGSHNDRPLADHADLDEDLLDPGGLTDVVKLTGNMPLGIWCW
jgi:hypothetical protein